MSFSVLFVCTGNICRSPMAQRLFAARVPIAAPVVSSSTGVRGLVGHPMDSPSADVLIELGGDPKGHVAQRLESAQIEAADLILTAEAGHRSVVLQMDPLAFRRTFTFREFGRLAAGLDPLNGKATEADLRARVTVVAGQRGVVPTTDPGEDDITDPFGQPMGATRTVGGQVSDAVDAIIGALGLVRSA